MKPEEIRREEMQEDAGLQPDPLTAGERLALFILIAVSALWGILLWKLAGWLVWWVKSLW